MLKDGTGLCISKFFQHLSEPGIFIPEDRAGKKCGIDSAGLIERKGADRDAGGHLDDGKKRLESFQGLCFHGNAEDREGRLGGGHTGQMCSAARAGDNHLEAPFFGA